MRANSWGKNDHKQVLIGTWYVTVCVFLFRATTGKGGLDNDYDLPRLRHPSLTSHKRVAFGRKRALNSMDNPVTLQ